MEQSQATLRMLLSVMVLSEKDRQWLDKQLTAIEQQKLMNCIGLVSTDEIPELLGNLQQISKSSQEKELDAFLIDHSHLLFEIIKDEPDLIQQGVAQALGSLICSNLLEEAMTAKQRQRLINNVNDAETFNMVSNKWRSLLLNTLAQLINKQNK